MKKLGKIDTITKEYMKDPVIFADMFNKFLYHGKQVIRPESFNRNGLHRDCRAIRRGKSRRAATEIQGRIKADDDGR